LKTEYWKVISVVLIIALFLVSLGWAKELSEKVSIQTENAQLKSQIAAFQGEAEQLKNKVSSLVGERDRLLENSKILEDQIVKLNSTILILQDEKVSVQRENAELKERIGTLQKEINQLKSEVSLLENQNQELLKEREKLLERIKVLEDQIVKLNNTIAALQEEIERLREKQIETVKLEPPLFLLTGENRVDGFHHPFYDELHIRIEVSAAAGYRLIKGLENFALQRSWRTLIFVIPPSPEGIGEYREVEEKYPDLTPISSTQIERFIQKYGVPFLYFARDSNNRIIGVIVTNSAGANLARLLVEKIILNTPFRYEDGEIKILKD